MDPLITALLSLLGVIIGGALLYAGNRQKVRADRQTHQEAQRQAVIENRFKARFDAVTAFLTATDELRGKGGTYVSLLSADQDESRAADEMEQAFHKVLQAGPAVEVLFVKPSAT